MTSLAVLGAGAFGTSLALALARDTADVTLWARDSEDAKAMQASRMTGKRLPGHPLPERLTVTSDLDDVREGICLLALPMQQIGGFLEAHADQLRNRALIACCKGVDLKTGTGPVKVIQTSCPSATPAILTGPSFAADIAVGLPTALVLASPDDGDAKCLQEALNRPTLRVYRTTDVPGAELGGALKNVIAIAAGITIGAGLGDSARASVIARGFAEIQRYASSKGAQAETLQGLSGLGDMILTCTSEKSRNFSAGMALGRGETLDPNVTVEGVATSVAVAKDAAETGLDLPLTTAVAAVATGEIDIPTAIQTLLSRPAKKE